MKKSEILMNQVTEIKAAAAKLTVATEINAKITEIENLQAQIVIAQMQEEEEEARAEAIIVAKKLEDLKIEAAADPTRKKSANSIEAMAFCKAIAKMPLDEFEIKALSILTDANGKLLVPTDVQTSINEWKRRYQDMSTICKAETVRTMAGTRIYEVEADSTPFTGVAELVAIPMIDEPTFQPIKFALNYMKGMLEIPNEVIKNADASLIPYIGKWIARKVIATNNALAFYGDGTKTDGFLGMATGGIALDKTLAAAVTISKLDDIIDVTLPAAIADSATCVIITNQTGFNYLKKLENAKSGVRFIQPDVTRPGVYQYNGKDIVKFDDKVLKNAQISSKTQFPVLIGDFEEAMTIFNLEKFTTETSAEAGFKNDSTLMRTIGAVQSKLIDKNAVVGFYSPLV